MATKILFNNNTTETQSSIFSDYNKKSFLKIYATAGDNDWGGASVNLQARLKDGEIDSFIDIWTNTGVDERFSTDTLIELSLKNNYEYRLDRKTAGSGITAIIRE